MGDAWAAGIGAYEVASRRYHRAPEGTPEHESPERDARAKRLRGSIADRLDAMEPPPAGEVQPGGAVHVKRTRPPESARSVRPRADERGGGAMVWDEILLDDLEQKYKVQAGNVLVPTNTWTNINLNYYPDAGGTDVSSRIGRSYVMRRLCVRGLLLFSTAATSDTLYCRIAIVRDGVGNTGALNTPNTQGGCFVGDGSLWVLDHYNPSTVGDGKRYQILADRVFNEQKICSVLRRSFAFCIDIPDEVVTQDTSTTYPMPGYVMVATCNGNIQPTLYWSAQVVYVDP